MAATVGGSTWGVAKDVNLFAVKVLNEAGEGTLACVISGIEFVGQRNGRRVATLSMNCPFCAALNNAVDGAVRAGGFVAVAAGNNNEGVHCHSGLSTPPRSSPVSAPLGVTVGATTSLDQRWTSSNFGTCLDIFAPGQDITSATIDPALDHFKCYKAWQPWPRFEPRQVTLEDQFENKLTTVERPLTVCNPVDKSSEGILDPTAHLTCFDTSDVPDQPPFETRDVIVENQFGLQRLTVTGARSLCVPSEKNGVASSLKVGHFKCYDVDHSGFDPLTVTLEDQFEDKETVVKEPVRICNPVINSSEGDIGLGTMDPSGHLTRYSIRNRGPWWNQWLRDLAEIKIHILLVYAAVFCVAPRVT